jgi:hypothetical protein
MCVFFRRLCPLTRGWSNTDTAANTLPLAITKKLRINRRDEVFISRKQLADRWNLSMREIIAREKDGPLKELVYKFSYKVHRYRLSDIVRLEEAAKVAPRE